jgi:hypothetical protein
MEKLELLKENDLKMQDPNDPYDPGCRDVCYADCATYNWWGNLVCTEQYNENK